MHTSVLEKYQKDARKVLAEELGIKNELAIPKIQKVVINMGTGELHKNKEVYQKTVDEIAAISGQKPAVRAARISVAGFNLRAGTPVGLTVTLRGVRMYQFLDKLISVVLPRLRDFRGVPTKSFDPNGNYTLGFTEHTVFPEIDLAKVDRAKGLEVTIVSNAGSKEKGRRLLELLGMPFEKNEI